jgi:hypothetical protein
MQIEKKLVLIAVAISVIFSFGFSLISGKSLIVSVDEAKFRMDPSYSIGTTGQENAGGWQSPEAAKKEAAEKQKLQSTSFTDALIWLRVEFLLTLGFLLYASFLFFLTMPIVAIYGSKRIDSVQNLRLLVKKSQLVAISAFFFAFFLVNFTPLAPPETSFVGY